MTGKIEGHLVNKIKKDTAIHLSLLDPMTTSMEDVPRIAKEVEEAGSSGIMVGGSTVGDTDHLTGFVSMIKNNSSLPIILFPNNVSGLTKKADAVWFMSLMNSRNPYYMTGAQMLAAFTVKRYGLEAIPMGYIIVGEGGASRIIGDANSIPYNKPEVAAAYALAASYLGMRFIYLESGSGVEKPAPPEFISVVRRAVPNRVLVVGGGIRKDESAYMAVKAGADMIVTGTLTEDPSDTIGRLSKVVDAVKRGGAARS